MNWQLKNAGVAQSVEQLIRNQQIVGSSPITSSTKNHHQVVFLFERTKEGVLYGENIKLYS